MLRHAIQDLIDQGLVDLGHPTVTIDPFPTHDTRAGPPPTSGVHLIEFSGDKTFMMGWDGMERLYNRSVYAQTHILVDTPLASKSLGHSYLSQMRFPDILQFSPVYLQHVPPMTPFILFSKEYGPIHRMFRLLHGVGG